MDIEAVSFVDKNGIEIILYPQGEWDNIDFNVTCHEEGTDYIVYKPRKRIQNAGIPILSIADSIDGKKILRLCETVTYTCRQKNITNDSADMICKDLCFPNEKNNKYLKVIRDRDAFSFTFVNYLGRTYLNSTKGDVLADFEIVPLKMNYEEDYVELTKRLAEECSEILLEYSGVTFNRFITSETVETKSVLEQFIFLRKFCYSSNLYSLFGFIKRNPDRLLIKDESLKPVGMGLPSSGFYSSPFSHGREWKNFGGRPLPQKITVIRKYDSLDTPANRFVKFALKKFNTICKDLCRRINPVNRKKPDYIECYREASEIITIIDDILRDHFFDSIKDLTVFPMNNQVLQKREGYRQIFSAAMMVDLALQLHWEGAQEVYNGESKNTALLYEYWLFFELRKIISSISNCECIQAPENPFISVENGLTISLCEGKTSCQAFMFPDLGTRVNLYYNRTFPRKEFSSAEYSGSYSRPFRPDYTLEVYPSEYISPAEAVREGNVSYIHFDAKYRINDLKSFVGSDESEMTDDQIERELEEEKKESITNTYKRGDLLKMHTYNDAIRRSVGSYVLYPGDFNSSLIKNYRLFEEILPGVGAFAIKPSIQSESENKLKDFIKEIIETRSKKYSRLNRILAYSNSILNEPAISNLDKRASGKDYDNKDIHNDLCAIGYINPAYYRMLISSGLLSLGKKFVYYYYAIKGESVYLHHEDIGKAYYFRFYQNNVSENGIYLIEPYVGIIRTRQLVSKSHLNEILKSYKCIDNEERFADFYCVLVVEIVNCTMPEIRCKADDLNRVNGNDTFSPYSPKVVTKQWLSRQLQ